MKHSKEKFIEFLEKSIERINKDSEEIKVKNIDKNLLNQWYCFHLQTLAINEELVKELIRIKTILTELEKYPSLVEFLENNPFENYIDNLIKKYTKELCNINVIHNFSDATKVYIIVNQKLTLNLISYKETGLNNYFNW